MAAGACFSAAAAVLLLAVVAAVAVVGHQVAAVLAVYEVVVVVEVGRLGPLALDRLGTLVDHPCHHQGHQESLCCREIGQVLASVGQSGLP